METAARAATAGEVAPAKPVWQTKTLHDVLDHIKAPVAWAKTRGAGVTLGIVDTGISSVMAEFPASNRSPFSKSFAYTTGPWQDYDGHGSMCACIAAATRSAGGRYDGVAPEATLLSARSNLRATDIYKLYDWVLSNKKSGAIAGPIVMSNSYGLYRCQPPPGLPEDHPYRGILLEAIESGIVVVFAAGNNHSDVLCNHPPAQCFPNTIWGVNSMDEVLCVGSVNWDDRLDVGAHANSSRGPGQWAKANLKPDCVAPTYGEVIWGSGYRSMEWWGTSGATPQVAGLAALLLSAEPALKVAEVADLIRRGCEAIPGQAASCVGSGVIDCAKATSLLDPKKARKRTGTARKKSASRPKGHS
jgi:subtilisin family serine protease